MNWIELEKDFSAKTKEYSKIKESSENLVVREQWASGHLYDLEPLETKRLGEDFGTVLKKKPARTNGKIGYFFDSQDRIRIRRVGTELPGQYYEEFFIYKPKSIESAYFGPTKMKELINVKSRNIENGKVIEILTVGKRGNRREQFNYEDDKLLAIDVEEFKSSQRENINRFQVVPYYDVDKNVNKVENIFLNGFREQLYPIG